MRRKGQERDAVGYEQSTEALGRDCTFPINGFNVSSTVAMLSICPPRRMVLGMPGCR